jgi:hypothetical protein
LAGSAAGAAGVTAGLHAERPINKAMHKRPILPANVLIFLSILLLLIKFGYLAVGKYLQVIHITITYPNRLHNSAYKVYCEK